MKPMLPSRLKEALVKTVGEIGGFIDAEVSIDTKNPELGADRLIKAQGPIVYVCQTTRVVNDATVGFVFSPTALVHMAKALLLLPYKGTADADVNDEVIEAFGEVFNVVVGTWNRLVDERDRLRAAKPGEAIIRYEGEQFAELLSAGELAVWSFRLSVQTHKHTFAFVGDSEWLGAKADNPSARKVAKPRRPGRGAEGVDAPTDSAATESVEAEQAASEPAIVEPIAGETDIPTQAQPPSSPPPSSPIPASPPPSAPIPAAEALPSPQANAAQVQPSASDSTPAADAKADDDYFAVSEDDDGNHEQLEEYEADDGFVAASSAPLSPAYSGSAAKAASSSPTSTSVPAQSPMLIVDDTGALATWLSMQLESGRLRCMKPSATSAQLPPGSAAVLVNASPDAMTKLGIRQIYVIQAR